MNKLKLAHDYFMKHGSPENFSTDIAEAWEYADRMIEQEQRREDKTRPEVLREKEWQPDWSQSPNGFDWFAVDEDGKAYWYKLTSGPHLKYQQPFWNYDEDGGDNIKAPSFGYSGDWRESLRKRP